MDTKTQRRGPADTGSGRFAKLLGVSLLLHIPFTPWAALVGLLSLWSPPAEDVESPPITAIPVDLLEDQAPPAPAEPAPPETATEPAGAAEPSAAKPRPKPAPKLHDAGAPDADERDAESTDGASDAGTSATDAGPKRAEVEAGADVGPTDAGPRPISEPAVAGGVKRVADMNANVRLWIYTDKIRQTPQAARLGPLLRSLYQWRDFFGPTGIDPIRDIDEIMVVASQLRDTSNLVAILKHHVPPDRMHTAVDALVRADHSGGMWLDAGVPAASAHADNVERRFILANPQTVIVTTPAAYSQALAVGKMLRLPPSSGPEAVIAYLVTPWRAFIGWPVQVPHSIKWARIRVTPSGDGGATAELDAEDETDAQASEDAGYLTHTANALSQLNLGFLGSLLGQQSHKFVEHVAFSASGKMIHGSAQITADQLSTALDLAGALLADRNARHESARLPPQTAGSASPAPR